MTSLHLSSTCSYIFDSRPLNGCDPYLTVAPIYVFQMTGAMEHLLMCLLAVSISSAEEYLFRLFVYLKKWIFFIVRL